MLLIGTITWSYLLITVFYGNKQSCNVHAWHPSISIKLIVLYTPLVLDLQFSFPIYPSIETIGHKKIWPKVLNQEIAKINSSKMLLFHTIQSCTKIYFAIHTGQHILLCSIQTVGPNLRNTCSMFPGFQRRSSFL